MQAGFFPTESLTHEWLTYIKQHDTSHQTPSLDLRPPFGEPQ